MKLKPSLDVESIEDFKKYYEGAYLKGRDGTIWKVREVATRSKQVVMQIGHEGTFDELTIFDWEKIGRTLRFGRYFPGIFVSGNVMLYVSDSAERSVTRGLNFREVGLSTLGNGVNPTFNNEREGGRSAWDALRQDYLINPTDVWSELRAGRCVVLNRFMGIAPHELPRAAVFVRETYIGCVDVDTRQLYVEYAYYWTTYGRILTKAFNGDLRYVESARKEKPKPEPTTAGDVLERTRAQIRAINAITEEQAALTENDWRFLRPAAPSLRTGQYDPNVRAGLDDGPQTVPPPPPQGHYDWRQEEDTTAFTTTGTTVTTPYRRTR